MTGEESAGEQAGETPTSVDAATGGGVTSGADRALEAIDQRFVDVLERLMTTETRARIYVYLRMNPGCTSDEVGRGTGLYPSTVRETLAAMTEEGLLDREKRESAGAGNNPYEYTAIPPSALVRELVDGLQEDLNTVCNLDHYLAGRSPGDAEPVRIEVRDRGLDE